MRPSDSECRDYFQSFPTLCNERPIRPILKKSYRPNIDNYCGIVISSCVGKLYLKILTKHINGYMVASGLRSQNQCVFEQDHKRRDMLCVLNSIYESYVGNENQNNYIAFVDFSEYFDMTI